MTRAVLVTGVARPLGSRLAKALRQEPGVERVVGVDVVPPRGDTGGAEFVRADIRHPVLARVLAQAEVDTVVHLGVVSAPQGAGGRATMKEINVIGTMQLLAACQQAPGVRTLVVKSSSAIYGSSAKDPALFTEDADAKAPLRSGFARDVAEVEGYVRGLSRRRPDLAVTTLRMANVLGPTVDSPLASYFTLPVWPTPLGYDARLQLLHEDDAVEVMRRAATGLAPGVYNVAGAGVLLLSQAARRAGRPTVPVPAPLGGWVGETFRRAGVADFSAEQLRYLSHGRAMDCSRLSRAGFVPAYSTAATFADFLASRQVGRVVPQDLVDRVLDQLGRLRLLGGGPADA